MCIRQTDVQTTKKKGIKWEKTNEEVKNENGERLKSGVLRRRRNEIEAYAPKTSPAVLNIST